MKLKTKVLVAGAAGLVVVAGVVVVVKAVRRRTKRVLNSKIRRVLADVVQMDAEDFASADGVAQSLFMRRIEKLDTKQLMLLSALVQVGYFIKVSNIDPLHASKEEVEQAVNKFLIEERLTPLTRGDLLQSLDSTDSHAALKAAFGVLEKA